MSKEWFFFQESNSQPYSASKLCKCKTPYHLLPNRALTGCSLSGPCNARISQSTIKPNGLPALRNTAVSLGECLQYSVFWWPHWQSNLWCHKRVWSFENCTKLLFLEQMICRLIASISRMSEDAEEKDRQLILFRNYKQSHIRT